MANRESITFLDLKTQWHPAFCAAAKIELLSNRKELDFKPEYNLSQKPLQIDLLIIEKVQDAVIQNEIGHIFKKYNIIEYKSPGDGMTIDDFIKTVGYAYIYKGLGERVNQIPLDELTVSLFREEKPKKLMEDLAKYGCRIEKTSEGIYYVYGLLIAAQIIVTKELDQEKHSSLRVLSTAAQEQDIRDFINVVKNFTEPGDRADADAVLQVSVSENMALYNEIMGRCPDVCEALRTLMKDEIAQEKKASVFDAMLSAIKNVMANNGVTAKQAMKTMGIPESDQAQYLAKLQ